MSYPDRLTRFGYDTLKDIFSHFGTEITTPILSVGTHSICPYPN